MLHLRTSARRRALTTAALLTIPLLPAAADLGESTLPLAPHGDAMGGPAGSVTPLAADAFLIGVYGADGIGMTDDDTVLLVRRTGGIVVTTPLPAPHSTSWGGGISVASATRAAILHAGADRKWNSADDGVWVFDRIGSEDLRTGHVVGFVHGDQLHPPVWLDADTLLVTSCGPDGKTSTADDRVARIQGAAAAATVEYLPAPYTPTASRSRPVPLSPTSFLLVSDGPDGVPTSADDRVRYYSFVGGGLQETDIPTPHLFEWGASVPVRVTETRAVICSAGPDALETTADDRVLVLEGLGTANQVLEVPVPSIAPYGGGLPVRADATAVLVTAFGEDGMVRTADDEIVAVHDLGGDVQADGDVIGFLGNDAASRAVLLDRDTAVVATAGPDGEFGNADDRIMVLDEMGPGQVHFPIPMPGLSERMTSLPVAVGAEAFLVSHGGPDGTIGNGDDAVTLVTSPTETPATESVAVPGGLHSSLSGHRARLLGHGRAGIVCPGGDGNQGTGGDDLCLLLDGLPTFRDLVVTSAEGRTPGRKGKPTFEVRATLTSDDLDPFDGQDVTFSVGNAAQTLRGSAFKLKRGVWTYADPKARRGFVKKLSWNSRKGTLTVIGGGRGTGLETTDPEWLPVTLASGETRYADTVAAKAKKWGFNYRAPKGR